MLLYLLAFFGGVLTIVSPCILPVLPLVFARANEPFRKSGLPLLLGMAATFALVAGVATFAGSWVVRANQVGRVIAMVVFAILGLALLFPRLATYLTTPLVRLGARFQTVGAGQQHGVGSSVLLGVSTGLLWAPCAGPILGLILTGAAVSGPSLNTGFLLLAFSLGAAASLALALLAGGRVFSLMKKSLGAEEWIRRGLGVAVLLGVVAIATGLDTGILRKLSLATTSGIEQKLIDQVQPGTTSTVLAAKMPGEPRLSDEGAFPGFEGGGTWFNSPALSKESLVGKVVLVDFWTYSCINCLRSIPYVEAWAEKYRDQGLVVVGVHTPEFAFEKDSAHVVDAIKDLKVSYPVVMDNDYAIWKAFKNNYWPAHFFIDAKGTIRQHHFGEGGYVESEMVIRELLKENGSLVDSGANVTVAASGAQASADFGNVKSPETYLGYARAKNNVSVEPVLRNAPQQYSVPRQLDVNQWGLSGSWKVTGENAQLVQAGGKVVFRFHARDLHLVLGPSMAGKPIRFKVTVDGDIPGQNHGVDIDSAGNGAVTEYRLYQLVRQAGPVMDHTFEIEFLNAGVQAFAFTFG
jgi:cytochrome c biogenesis protein CcdA/thiol-disulfide isomerase/thioredoxin